MVMIDDFDKIVIVYLFQIKGCLKFIFLFGSPRPYLRGPAGILPYIRIDLRI